MQELVGRLTALDPEASETLQVIAYFDALVAGGVGVESLLRGAAVLSGAVAGHRQGDRLRRIGPDGAPPPAPSAPREWPSRPAGERSAVWLERAGAPHASDAMVLERLALAAALTTARRGGDDASAVEVALSDASDDEQRMRALARLRLDVEPSVRVVALPREDAAPDAVATAVVATTRGLVRAALVPEHAVAGLRTRLHGPVGLGTPVPPDRLPDSWAAARIALRIASADQPIAPTRTVDAVDLGALLLVAAAAESAVAPHPDVVALAGLDRRGLALLDAVAAHGSVRAAAAARGIHHSSAQQRLRSLADRLGYDPTTGAGRARFGVARLLLALDPR